VFRENHEFDFQEKLASFGGSYIQASKKKFATKGKGEKKTPLEIVEVPKDVTMVDYEVINSNRDFVEVHEGFERRRSNKCLDLSLDSF